MTDIKTLNDNLRKHLIGGKIVLTQGIEAKTYEEIAEIMLKIRHFILLIITAFNFLYVNLLYLSLNCLLKSNVNGLMFVNFFVSAIK